MKKFLFLIVLPIVLSGCFIKFKTAPPPDGGVFISQDKGKTFEQISFIATTAEAKQFNGDNALFLKMDPTDSNTLYYSSRESGVLVTYDRGKSWRPILKDKGFAFDLAIDPESPCVLYAATRQNILKSGDCGRRWEAVYLEKVPNRSIVDLDMDRDDSRHLFSALSDGTIISSQDFGNTWQVWYRFDNPLERLYLNPQNTQIMYAVTTKDFLRSADQGRTWQSLKEVISKEYNFRDGHRVTNLVFLPEFEDAFYTVSLYGILKTTDGGTTWDALPLLPQPKKQEIFSIAINPRDSQELYYGTEGALYYSADGGINWETLAAPTARRITQLIVHPKNSSVVYLAVQAPPK